MSSRGQEPCGSHQWGVCPPHCCHLGNGFYLPDRGRTRACKQDERKRAGRESQQDGHRGADVGCMVVAAQAIRLRSPKESATQEFALSPCRNVAVPFTVRGEHFRATMLFPELTIAIAGRHGRESDHAPTMCRALHMLEPQDGWDNVRASECRASAPSCARHSASC